MASGITPYNEHILLMEGRIIEFAGNLDTLSFLFQKTYKTQPALVGIIAPDPDAPLSVAAAAGNINIYFTDITLTGATINTSTPYKGRIHVHVQGTKS